MTVVAAQPYPIAESRGLIAAPGCPIAESRALIAAPALAESRSS